VHLKEYVMEEHQLRVDSRNVHIPSQKNLKVVSTKWVLFWPSRSEFDGVEFSSKAYLNRPCIDF
jgi:hypothetical protein